MWFLKEKSATYLDVKQHTSFPYLLGMFQAHDEWQRHEHSCLKDTQAWISNLKPEGLMYADIIYTKTTT